MESFKSARRTTRSARGEIHSRPSSEPEMATSEEIAGWIIGRLPESWFEQAPMVTIDRDEILIIGRLSAPDLADDVDTVTKAAESVGSARRLATSE